MGKKLQSGSTGQKIVTDNRKAGFRYFFLEKFEAGMVLTGSEVKSLRDGKANLGDSYVVRQGGDLALINCHISPYAPANRMNHDPLRSRRLLLHAEEIEYLIGKMKERGLTLIPTKLYFKKGRAKCEIALAKGKKLHDRREELKKKEHVREIERAIKGAKG
ncbi:MAG: SsrA-binding protein SmpB [Deltaproteobacteria bacterium]|nr:SsrA-binding protein SmpB [Deltaproteobacteria bacterium]MBI4374261.1 SsrA-binding protein SmpB [Deltaproteobacteria bacterium]